MKIFMKLVLFLLPVGIYAQTFTHQDTLRGSITPQRAWWDLSYYRLAVKVNPADSTLSGTNVVGFIAIEPGEVMQIDLQYPMQITKALFEEKPLSYERVGNAYFIHLPGKINKGEKAEVELALQAIQESPDVLPGMGGSPGAGISQEIHSLLLPARDWGQAFGGHVRIICTMRSTA